MPFFATQSDIESMERMRADGKTTKEVADHFQCQERTVRRKLNGDARQPKHKSAPDKKMPIIPEREYEECGDKASLKFTTSRPIRTLKELEAACEVDLTKWTVAKWKCKAWTTAMKMGGGENARTESVQNYSVSADFQRIMAKPLQDASDAIFERLKLYSPKYTGLPKMNRVAPEGFLGVMCLFDAHFGKRCWAPESGNHYDLAIAEKVYSHAVDDLIAQAKGKSIERWCYVIGNDMIHIDNAKNTTYNNTPQDVDGRYAKIIESAEIAVISAIERMMEIAPVDCILINGNHDQTTSYHLARTVNAWFNRSERVNVDYAPMSRKYYRWHKTLIGLCHGCDEKFATLPSLMATERPKDWADTDCREWLLGHMHRSRQWQTQSVDSHEGTVIRALKSLAGTDRWHFSKGYVSGPNGKAAELYLYNKRGYAGHSVVNAREG